ncbi:hypothetical protein ACFL1H_01485 [Nanoarchaeota archaeon]
MVDKKSEAKSDDEKLWEKHFGDKKKDKIEYSRVAGPEETDYPKATKNYRLLIEDPNLNIELIYFWILNHLTTDLGFNNVIKITDLFAASELSAIAGHSATRIGQIHDRAGGMLRGMSEMLKGLFQIVREVRVIDTRLSYYYDSEDENHKEKHSAEIVLKGTWVDQVEGGAKAATSVYGLAREVGFTILPDLFFRLRIKKSESIDERVRNLPFNNKVKEMVKRKLKEYYEWKKRSKKELETRRKFELKYLRQHYDNIRLMVDWVKPYLKTVRKMQARQKMMDSHYLVQAFETSKVEIEVMLTVKPGNVVANDSKMNAVVILHFDYTTKPSMSATAESYQRGPVHIGRCEITFRSYAMTDDEIKSFRDYREEQDMALVSTVDSSISGTMDALGDDLKEYLEEAGEEFPDKDEPAPAKPKRASALDPFISVFKGFAEIGSSFKGDKGDKPPPAQQLYNSKKAQKDAATHAKVMTWIAYKNYKKAHGLITW